MKKFLSKIIVFFMCITVLLGCFGCGGGSDAALNIMLFEGGFGTKWLDNIVDEYEKETGKKVKVVPESIRDKISAEFSKRTNQQQYDLYFFDSSLSYYYATTEYIIPGVKNLLTDITDVYNYTPKGESRSIKDKMFPFMSDYYNVNGKYYYINWAICSYGITYNTALISDANIPVTTNELIKLSGDLSKDGMKAFIFSGKENYWNQMFYTWWAQYNGVKTFDEFFEGKVGNNYSVEIFRQLGRLKSYEVLEDLLLYTNNKIVENSASSEFRTAQNNFLEGTYAAMMVNGAWIENESLEYFEGEIPIETNIMKTPVISSIIENCTTIENDQELSCLIKAIDKGQTTLQGEGYNVNKTDYDTIAEARNLLYYAGETHNAVVPTTGKHPDEAKEFLKFMYSDKGINLYLDAKSCSILPVNFDYESNATVKNSYSKIMKTSLDHLLTSKLFTIKRTTNIIEDGHIIEACKNQSLEFCFGAPNEADRMSAKDMYDCTYNYYSEGDQMMWIALLNQKGIPIN